MSRRIPRAGGFTVLEILVACSVAIVILVLLSDVFLTALHRTQDGRLRVDMQQRALFAINRWERDIETTGQRSIVVKTGDPYCVALTQATGVSAGGAVTWSEQLICYAFVKSRGTWQRETYPPKAPAFSGGPSVLRPYLPTLVELDSLTTQVSGEELVLCEDVQEFSLTDRNGNTGPLGEQPLLFHLKLRRPLSTSGQFTEFTVDRRYTLRNSF